jgi:hypothetical protein
MWSVLSGMETTLMAALAIGTFAALAAPPNDRLHVAGQSADSILLTTLTVAP